MADNTKTGAWAGINALLHTLTATIAAFALTADGFTLIGRVRAAGKVASVTYYPNAAATGANTETRTLRVYNRTTGGGTTLIATLALTLGVDLTAKTAKTFTLTATLGDRVVSAGDLLEVKSDHSGSTGLADPGGRIEVEITPTQT